MTQQECPSPRRGSTLVGLLRQRAAECPDRLAFSFLVDAETVKETLTYAELDRRARSVAATLQARGLTGERALLLFPPSLDYIVAFFGCLYAGVIAVPAYPPRRNRSLDRLQAIVASAQVATVLTTGASSCCRHDSQMSLPGNLVWLLGDAFRPELADLWEEPALSPDSLAFLQYTSGSTATPRGVMLTHGNLLHNSHCIEQRFENTADTRGVIWLPPYHDMGLIGGILQPIYTGFICYLMSPVSLFSNPFSWLQAISRHQGTASGGPNFAYELCVRKVTPEQKASLDLSHWGVAFTGAEPVRAETLDRFAESFASCGFRREAFYPCYGLAEATLLATGAARTDPPRVLRVSKAALESHRAVYPLDGEDAQPLVGCGKSLPDQEVVIVHPEKLTRCWDGDVGEVWVQGPSVASGYWGQPEETRQTFAAYLADLGEGPFLRTGDLGFLHDGELFVTGRLKDLIILRGRNLYPQDLERTAERSHPDLSPGCGAAFSIEADGQERLVIAYEAAPRRAPGAPVVGEAVRAAIADEHEVDLYAFVLLQPGSVPKTSSGKIQRGACRRAFLSGTLDAIGEWRSTGQTSGSGIHLATLLTALPSQRQTLLETHFRDQLARVLGLAPSAVDPHQPLNTLGLSSLHALEFKNALEGRLRVALPVSSFFDGASIVQLVSQVLAELPTPGADHDSRPGTGGDICCRSRMSTQISLALTD